MKTCTILYMSIIQNRLFTVKSQSAGILGGDIICTRKSSQSDSANSALKKVYQHVKWVYRLDRAQATSTGLKTEKCFRQWEDFSKSAIIYQSRLIFSFRQKDKTGISTRFTSCSKAAAINVVVFCLSNIIREVMAPEPGVRQQTWFRYAPEPHED